MEACIYMVESLHSSPETITALLIGYTYPQYKMFLVLKKFNLKRDLAILNKATVFIDVPVLV